MQHHFSPIKWPLWADRSALLIVVLLCEDRKERSLTVLALENNHTMWRFLMMLTLWRSRRMSSFLTHCANVGDFVLCFQWLFPQQLKYFALKLSMTWLWWCTRHFSGALHENNLLFGTTGYEYQHIPFNTLVIRLVVECLIFSYLRSLPTVISKECNISITAESSTGKRRPKIVTLRILLRWPWTQVE